MRLIDADALIDCIKDELYNQADDWYRLIADALIKCINDQPTIKADLVRHGRMIEGRYPNGNKCSECGQEFRDDIGFIIQDDDGEFHFPKRCPECGAHWDGEGSKANGCWITCNNCANTSCPNRDEEEGKSDGTG